MVINKKQLTRQLTDMKLNRQDTILIHSSMKAIGPVEDGPEGVIDVLMDYFQKGLLILPTHTWSQINAKNPIFDPLHEPSCVGLLTNIFRERHEVYRSWHPTHSVGAFGKEAKAYVAGEEHVDTPCPRHGCWGKLIDLKAKIMFLGCGLKNNTFLHGVEEWHNIPGRISSEWEPLKIRRPDGSLMDRPMRRHEAPAAQNGVSDHYDKMEPLLKAAGYAYNGSFGKANCVVCDAEGMDALTGAYLAHDQDLFLDDRPVSFLPL